MHFVILAACAHYFGDFTFVMPEVIAKELAERAQESSREEDAHLPDRTRKAMQTACAEVVAVRSAQADHSLEEYFCKGRDPPQGEEVRNAGHQRKFEGSTKGAMTSCGGYPKAAGIGTQQGFRHFVGARTYPSSANRPEARERISPG